MCVFFPFFLSEKKKREKSSFMHLRGPLIAFFVSRKRRRKEMWTDAPKYLIYYQRGLSLSLSQGEGKREAFDHTHEPLIKKDCWYEFWKRHSTRHASPLTDEAQCAFKILMIHWVVQFALRIAVRSVLHRYTSREIHRWKSSSLVFVFSFSSLFLLKTKEERRRKKRKRYFSITCWFLGFVSFLSSINLFSKKKKERWITF